jgi:hypothetical protein
MWWPQTPGWWEARDAFGATQPGTLWALGSGEVTGPPTSAATYVLVANTSAWEASVRVSVVFGDGTPAELRTFLVNPTSRFNVDVGAEFPGAVGKRFGVVVESVPTATDGAAQIVVEGARYHNDTAGVVWAAGADALATRWRRGCDSRAAFPPDGNRGREVFSTMRKILPVPYFHLAGSHLANAPCHVG